MFLSDFLLGALIMKKPFVGAPVSFGDYFKGGLGTHLTGILGGIIWGVGMSFNIIALGRAGFAISFGLGQGAKLVEALFGGVIWGEFRTPPCRPSYLLASVVACLLARLVLVLIVRPFR